MIRSHQILQEDRSWVLCEWGNSHAGPSHQNNSAQCGYYGKLGHYEAECRKKKSESAFTSRQITNYDVLAVSGDQPDKGQSRAKRTGQVGKGGRKRGTRGVTEGKEWGHKVEVTLG